MIFRSCPERERVLAATGHVVVTGGPGCGKTTIALRKALVRIEAGLLPGEKILFLSFSRAAIARITQAARDELSRDARHHLEVQTFHSFFWGLVRGHGYLLGAPRRIRLLSPHDERARRNGAKGEDPAWKVECERLFREDGLLSFDLFATKALALLQGSHAIRSLVASRYPLIIVDEAQDTGDEQWACLEQLAGYVQLMCLADLEQQIYDFRPEVSPERLAQIVATLDPLLVELGGENNRSPGLEIVKFGNDILARTARGSPYSGISRLNFQPEAAKRDKQIRAAVGLLSKRVFDATGHRPESIGYLTNWGKGVMIIARALQGGVGAPLIPHRVVMDEVEVLLATRIVALCLEPVNDVWISLADCLDLLRNLYSARGNVGKADLLSRSASNARSRSIRGNAKCPKAMKEIIEGLGTIGFSGSPAQDWLAIRRSFEKSQVEELVLVARLVIYLMAFNRGRRIADSLSEVWQRRGRYDRARAIIESAIAEDQIMGGGGGLTGINVMTTHKSKGKEFDGVIILHLGNNLSPLNPQNEVAPHAKSRKLLRVGVTRARNHTLLLTDAYSPSPLLTGHKL